MTELAAVFGIELGTVWVGIESSSDSRCLTVAWRARFEIELGTVWVGIESSSDSRCLTVVRLAGFGVELATAFELGFDLCGGTPVGRIAFGFSSSVGIAVGSAARQKNASPIAHGARAKRDQRFMGGKFTDKDSMHASGGYKSSPRWMSSIS